MPKFQSGCPLLRHSYGKSTGMVRRANKNDTTRLLLRMPADTPHPTVDKERTCKKAKGCVIANAERRMETDGQDVGKKRAGSIFFRKPYWSEDHTRLSRSKKSWRRLLAYYMLSSGSRMGHDVIVLQPFSLQKQARLGRPPDFL